MRSITFIACLSILILHGPVRSQDNCTDALKKAQRAYNEGIIEKVESQLKPCLEEGFTPEQKLEALKLIILANIYDEKTDEAEQNMLKFLEIEPEYEVNPASDPEEFANLFGTFQTSPLWSGGILFGPNFLSVRQLEEFGTYNTEALDFDEFRGHKFSFHAGFRVNRYLVKNVEASIDLLLEQDQLKYTILPDYDRILQEETQTSISLPLSFTYDFLSQKKLRPFIRAGTSVSYLLSASASTSRTYEDGSPNTNETGTIDLIDQRKTIHLALLGGIGAKLKVKRAFLVLDVRYRYGLNNLVNEEERYNASAENYDRLFRIHHVDNDFSIDKVSISVGYIRNFYKPRRRTHK